MTKLIRQALAFCFALSLIMPPSAHAQPIELPAAGKMLELSKPYMPMTVRGLMIHPEAPFKFDFVVDSGDTGLKGTQFKEESLKLIKYFLAALTVPESEMWVNLSPYEKDRTIPKSFGDTEMGRDLLAQDYILKQLTASLTYPEKEMGKKFWDKVYAQAQSQFGTSNVPVNTFNKVWIVPSQAKIYEHGNSAFVVESRLKVMLEQDYLALQKNTRSPQNSSVASQIVREIVIPALEKEVNEGAHFANLRQVYQAMILATWYKIRLKDSILGKLYVDRNKTGGVALMDKQDNEKIYQQYLQAFKKGVYNYIREDHNAAAQVTPRKYVSGGFDSAMLGRVVEAGLGAKLTSVSQLAPRGDEAMVAWQAGTSPDTAMVADSSLRGQALQELEKTAKSGVPLFIPGFQKGLGEAVRGLVQEFVKEKNAANTQGWAGEWQVQDIRKPGSDAVHIILGRQGKFETDKEGSILLDWVRVQVARQAELKASLRRFVQEVTARTGADLTTKKLRGAFASIQKVLKNTPEAETKEQLRLLLNELMILTEHHSKIREARTLLQGMEDFSDKKKVADQFRGLIKDAADGIAKQIYEQTAKELNVILLVRVNEGIGRDEVQESFDARDVVVPDALRSELVPVNAAVEGGADHYIAAHTGKAYPVVNAIIDVIEGTNMFITNSDGKTLENISESESGSTSVIVVGSGVAQLGNAPDGYVGQFFTNLGDKAEDFKEQRVQADGREYSLFDPELYAAHPEKVEALLEYYAAIRGQQVSDLQEEIVVMDREREKKFLDVLQEIKERRGIAGLRVTTITDGTVAHGLKSVMDAGSYKDAFKRDYGVHKTMITVGGAAEGFMVLAVAGALQAKGAVGGLRVYNALMNDNEAGAKMFDMSERYNFRVNPKNGKDLPKEILRLRQVYKDGEAILKGDKLFVAGDVTKDIMGSFTFISTNGVFGVKGVEPNGQGGQAVHALRIEAFEGQAPVIALDRNIVKNGTISLAADNALLAIPSIDINIPEVRKFVDFEKDLMKPDEVVVIDAKNIDMIIQHAVEAGILFQTEDGSYASYSHPEDTMRSVPRTFVSSRNPGDKGLNNNWVDSETVLNKIIPKMKDSMAGKTMYVIPYIAGPEDKPVGKPGVQVTDSLTVVAQYLTLYNERGISLGKPALDLIAKRGGSNFIKISHSTGDLNSIKRTNKEGEDGRYFVLFINQTASGSGDIVDQYGLNIVRLYGSEYGGNGIGAKKFASLRLALALSILSEDQSTSHSFSFVLEDKATHETFGVSGSFPSYSGKTNSALLELIPELAEKYNIWMVSDDLMQWTYAEEPDGKGGTVRVKRGVNPEHGAFMVAPGMNAKELARAMDAIAQGGSLSVNLAYKFKIDPATQRRVVSEQWWEKIDKPLSLITLDVAQEFLLEQAGQIDPLAGWYDWKNTSLRGRLKGVDVDDIKTVVKYNDAILAALSARPSKDKNKLFQPEALDGVPASEMEAVRRGLKALWDALSGEGKELAHPNSRITVRLDKVKNWIGNVDQIPVDRRPKGWDNPLGVKSDLELFGGRRATTRPLVSVMTDPMMFILHGFFMRAATTAAEEGKAGAEGFDMFALRPFMVGTEGELAQHLIDRAKWLGKDNPLGAYVNWFKKFRNPNGTLGAAPVWPGFKDNSRVTIWLKDLKEGRIPASEYRMTPIGIIPTENASLFNGLNLSLEERKQLTEFNEEEWRQEVKMWIEYSVDKLKMDVPDELRRELEKLAKALNVELPAAWTNARPWAQMQKQKGRTIGVVDAAMTAKGGIDLNSKNLDLQIKRDAKGMPLPAQLQNLDSIKIDGLYPVILNVTPVTNLPLLLGLKEKELAPA